MSKRKLSEGRTEPPHRIHNFSTARFCGCLGDEIDCFWQVDHLCTGSLRARPHDGAVSDDESRQLLTIHFTGAFGLRSCEISFQQVDASIGLWKKPHDTRLTTGLRSM
jgi:hypothetical protein